MVEEVADILRPPRGASMSRQKCSSKRTIQIHSVGSCCIEHKRTWFINTSVGASTCFLTKLSVTLPSLSLQVGARECILEEQGPQAAGLEEIMARCGVLCTPKSLQAFKSAKDGTIKVQRCCTSFNSAVCFGTRLAVCIASLTLSFFVSRNPCRISQLLFALVASAVVPLLLEASRAEKAPTFLMSQRRVK